MMKSVSYGLVAVLTVAIFAGLAFADSVVVFDTINKRNVLFDLDKNPDDLGKLKTWLASPLFTRWTNMDALAEYLDERGYNLDTLKTQSRNLDNRDVLKLSGHKTFKKLADRGSFGNTEGVAITNIECDADDREVEFTLTNPGPDNWFLVPQELTEGDGTRDSKVLSDLQEDAKLVKIYVNSHQLNSMLPIYWFGEKLHYAEGETFADACRADFLRAGKSVKCAIEPFMMRGGIMPNDFMVLSPHFRERGTFTCE